MLVHAPAVHLRARVHYHVLHSSCSFGNQIGSLTKRRELGSTMLQRVQRSCFDSRRAFGRLLVTASEGYRVWGEVAQRDSQQRMLQVVLVSPQIPGNTGCIARTCAATCVGLHLVEPLGFKIEDSKLKRAGLDYWPYPPNNNLRCDQFYVGNSVFLLKGKANRYVVVKVHKSWSEFFTYFQKQEGDKRLLAFTKKGMDVHTDVRYKVGDWLLFGSEVDGLPAAALEECSTGQYAGGTVRLPMSETYVRSLNLSVSAGIAAYEALRQLDAHTNYSSLDVALSQTMEPVMSDSRLNDGFP